MPVDVDGGATNAKNINTFGRKVYKGGMTEFGAAGGGAGLGAVNTSTLTTENMHMYNQYGHYGGHDEMDFRGTVGHHLHRYTTGAFDGLAVSDQFLEEYYLHVSIQKSKSTRSLHVVDVLFIYTGSV